MTMLLAQAFDGVAVAAAGIATFIAAMVFAFRRHSTPSPRMWTEVSCAAGPGAWFVGGAVGFDTATRETVPLASSDATARFIGWCASQPRSGRVNVRVLPDMMGVHIEHASPEVCGQPVFLQPDTQTFTMVATPHPIALLVSAKPSGCSIAVLGGHARLPHKLQRVVVVWNRNEVVAILDGSVNPARLPADLRRHNLSILDVHPNAEAWLASKTNVQ